MNKVNSCTSLVVPLALLVGCLLWLLRGRLALLLVFLVLLLVLQQFFHQDVELFAQSLDGVLSILPELLAVLDLSLQ